MQPLSRFTPLSAGDTSARALERTIALALNQTVALHRITAGSLVRCLGGCCWLTLSFDTRDVILEQGDTFNLAVRNAPVVLTGMTETITVLVIEGRTPFPRGEASSERTRPG